MKKTPLSVSRWFWIAGAAVFLGILAAILWFAYQGQLPPILTQNDKLAHVVLYGVATFLGHHACNRRHIRRFRWPVPLFPALFGLFTLGEELSQSLSPNRSLDGLDLLASFAGIAIAYWLAERRWVGQSRE
jgi:VanZ family protein